MLIFLNGDKNINPINLNNPTSGINLKCERKINEVKING